MQTINGTVGDDYLEYGAPGTGFIIYGYAGNDYINTGGSGDSLFGGAGDDTMWGGTQTNYLDGGDGTDTLFFQASLDDPGSWSLAMYWRLDLGTSQYNPDYYPPNGMVNTLLNFENIVLINGASDRITGNALDNFLSAHQGNDTLSGLGGNDTLDGGAGDDSLQGGTGADTASYAGNLAAHSFSLSNGGGELVITDTDPSDGDDGVDVLSGMERAAFEDGTINITLNVRKDLYLDPELNQVPTTVLPLSGGGYMAVWWQGASNLLMQRFDVRGDSLGVPGILAETEGGGSLVTSAALDTGGFVLVWSQSGELGDDDGSSGVFGRIFDASGQALGERFQVNTQTEGNQDWAEVTTFPDGSFVVTWDSRSAVHSEGRVLIQRFDAVGQKIGGELLVNLESDGAYLPSVAALADGGCVAVWQAGPGDAPRIFLQRFVADGSRSGQEFVVELADAYVSQGAEVVAMADGGYLVGWMSAGVDPGGYNIYTRRFDASGEPLGNQQLVNRSLELNQFGVGLTPFDDGSYVAVYVVQGEGGVRSVYFQRIGPNGEYLGPETRVSDTGDTPLLDVATLEDGGFVITWSSVGTDGLVKSYAQEYTDEGYRIALSGDEGADHVTWSDTAPVALTGRAGDDVLSGGGGADLLEGNSGADTLDGGSGDDTLRGGTGDDTYMVDSAGDVLTELAGGGTDEVISALSYTLGSTLESLVLAGTGNLNGTGNSANNVIRGNAGYNVLSGGAGTDTLMGGDGSDSLVGGSGIDRLEGGVGADTLNGGPGLDAMAGGAGDDLYFVDARGDLITELAGEGTDVIRSAISRGLPVNVEQLVLTGSADLNGTGNGLANVLSGNSGNNSLSGGQGNDTLRGGFGNDTLLGGLGMDLMIGGAGDDSYSVSRGDKTIESVAGGTDTVNSGIDWTLAAQVEHLVLIGTGSVKGTGNAQGNAITGNQGNNTLDGRAGSDTLTGGDGADVFLFDTMLSAAGIDLISDFAVGIDKIRFDDDVFAAFTGTVTMLVGADQFVSGAGITTAQDATDRLIYDTDTGALYYDADGVGGVSAVQIAVLGTTHPGITAGDFVIVS